MRCSKCGYLGFEPLPRCRNCGYDFSLAPQTGSPDLPIRDGRHDVAGPLEDLALTDGDLTVSLDALRASPGEAAAVSAELPLFGLSHENEPLISKPSRPRAPLAVRRSTPETPRLRAEPRLVDVNLPLPDLREPLALPRRPVEPSAEEPRHVSQVPHATGSMGTAASLTARALASLIDLLILIGVDGVVVYFTLKISGLPPTSLALLPWGPLLTYLAMQHATYLVALTAAGQTLGKMALGIRVVRSGSAVAPDWSQSALRTAAWAVLAVPAGLGMLSLLFDADHRGLHDRLSGTRVVRATA